MDPFDEIRDAIVDIRRRLHALETAPRAPFTSITGGATRWLTESGDPNPQLYAGDLLGVGDIGMWVIDADGNSSVFVGTSGGAALVFIDGAGVLLARSEDGQADVLSVDRGRLLNPSLTTAWQKNCQFPDDGNGRAATTSVTYPISMWNAFVTVGRPKISTSIDIFVGAGVTSAQWKLTAQAIDGVFGYTIAPEVTIFEATTAVSTSETNTWTVPTTLFNPPRNPSGILTRFGVTVRVAGGAGTVGIGPIWPVYGSN